jgi:hypothetical protein
MGGSVPVSAAGRAEMAHRVAYRIDDAVDAGRFRRAVEDGVRPRQLAERFGISYASAVKLWKAYGERKG